MRVVLLGDSHSVVTNPYLKAKLEAEGHTVSLTLQNVGWSIHSYLSKGVLQQVKDAHPDVVVVKLGGNNYILNDAKYQEQYAKFLSAIGYPTTRVVWVGPYNANAEKARETSDKHDWTRQWLLTNAPSDITVIDTYPYSQSGHSPDGVHFTQSSYHKMIDDMYPQIVKAISKKTNPLVYVFGLSVLSLAVILIARTRRKNDTNRRIGKV